MRKGVRVWGVGGRGVGRRGEGRGTMAEEVVFGDFDAPSGYESRVVRTAFVGDSRDKLFFRVYFVNLVGRNEWADSPAGRAQQDEVLKSVASSVPSHGAVGFAVCFPHTCKIYQFDAQQETRLCARIFDPKKRFTVRAASPRPTKTPTHACLPNRSPMQSFPTFLTYAALTVRAGGLADTRGWSRCRLRCRGVDRGGRDALVDAI